jgi:hypothetical protein
MWKIVRFVNPLFILILGIVLIVWPRLLSILKLETKTIIGITLAIGAGAIFYFDQKIEKLSIKVHHFKLINLYEGIAQAFNCVKNPQKIRIFAFSTHVIEPIIRDLRMKLKVCEILIYSDNPNRPDGRSINISEDPLKYAPIEEWIYLLKDGLIDKLDIRVHNLYPLIYFVVFDDKALLLGNYLIDDEKYPKCDYVQPCFMLDENLENKIFIKNYINIFNSLFNSKQVNKLSLNIDKAALLTNSKV